MSAFHAYILYFVLFPSAHRDLEYCILNILQNLEESSEVSAFAGCAGRSCKVRTWLTSFCVYQNRHKLLKDCVTLVSKERRLTNMLKFFYFYADILGYFCKRFSVMWNCHGSTNMTHTQQVWCSCVILSDCLLKNLSMSPSAIGKLRTISWGLNSPCMGRWEILSISCSTALGSGFL